MTLPPPFYIDSRWKEIVLFCFFQKLEERKDAGPDKPKGCVNHLAPLFTKYI